MSAEPIETSVISIDTEMIIVQPAEINQVENDSNQNRNEQQIGNEINIATVEPSNAAEITPKVKRRKR